MGERDAGSVEFYHGLAMHRIQTLLEGKDIALQFEVLNEIYKSIEARIERIAKVLEEQEE